jgi:hypothetical protein
MSEPFASWPSPGNAWNFTFISLQDGSFNFIDTYFTNLVVKENETFISINLQREKKLMMKGCVFTGCGCLVHGKVINIESTNINEKNEFFVSILNSEFISCFGYKGGAFSLVKQRSEFNNNTFKNVSASGVGGGLFIHDENILIINDSKFEDIYSLVDGGILHGEGNNCDPNCGSITLNSSEIKNTYSKTAGGLFIKQVCTY